MKRKLRLVGQDPTDIFNDLGKLRAEDAALRAPKSRTTETYARIPHDRARALYRQLSVTAWALLIEIDRIVFDSWGKNPNRLTSDALSGSGLSRWAVDRGLRRLERAGVVVVDRKPGRRPVVMHLWYPVQLRAGKGRRP